jgi:hypothetical protein
MAAGTVEKYNNFEKYLFDTGSRQWNDATTGSNMFCLCTSAYTPADTHALTSDLAGLITSGDGAPINVVSPVINETAVPGFTYYDSDDADFGSAVTITAKWLVCVQPVTAGTFSATTSRLLWRVDLNTSGSFISTAGLYKIFAPTNGWIRSFQ